MMVRIVLIFGMVLISKIMIDIMTTIVASIAIVRFLLLDKLVKI